MELDYPADYYDDYEERVRLLQQYVQAIINIHVQTAVTCALQIQENTRQRIMRSRRLTRLRIQRRKIQAMQFLTQMMINWNINGLSFAPIRHRSVGALSRSTHWWDTDVLQKFQNDRFLENFRMTKEVFLKLCEKLQPILEPHPEAFNRVLSVQQKVAISLYKLSSCAEYRVVGNAFGVHKSTVHCVLMEFCQAVKTLILPEVVKLPDSVECKEISFTFRRKCKIPNIIGAIDGSHIPVTAPHVGFRDFVNRKGWPSVILQAVVDHRGLFRDITCQHPGSCHDASVLADSALFKNMESALPQDIFKFEDTHMKYMLLGDAAYGLLEQLLTPFRSPPQGPKESFNVYHSSGRIVVEQAFGRLKGRFRCLLKRLDVHISFVPLIVATCCALHNFLEMNNETFNQQWMKYVEEAQTLFPQPEVATDRRRTSVKAATFRNKLCEYMWANHPHLISALHHELQKLD